MPTWVYIIFLLLIYLGIKRCFIRIRTLKQLLILPAGLLYLSLHSLYKLIMMHDITIVIWLVAFSLSLILNIHHVKNHAIRADKKQQLIELPGDWTWLILLLIIFFVEFFINHRVDADPAIVASILFISFTALSSGLVAGISIGTNLGYYIKYLQTKHSNLIAPE